MTEARRIGLQASVFMNDQGCISDPENGTEGYLWVTTTFPKDIAQHFSDDDLLTLAVYQISCGEATIDDRAQHGLGANCISLPVKGVHRRERKLARAYACMVGEFWINQIKQKKVRLDRETLFESVVPRINHIHCLGMPYEAGHEFLNLPMATRNRPEV